MCVHVHVLPSLDNRAPWPMKMSARYNLRPAYPPLLCLPLHTHLCVCQAIAAKEKARVLELERIVKEFSSAATARASGFGGEFAAVDGYGELASRTPNHRSHACVHTHVRIVLACLLPNPNSASTAPCALHCCVLWCALNWLRTAGCRSAASH